MPNAAEPRRGGLELVPCLELVPETLLVEAGSREIQVAALRLTFDYGGVCVGLSDPAEALTIVDDTGARSLVRDRAAEHAVQCELERFGPVEVDCLVGYVRAFGTSADYVVDPEGDPQALCHFGAHVIPKLRERGWRVDVREDYPCRIVTAANWHARVEPTEESSDWFELQLGVDVEGRRVDLLPMLVDLLQTGSAALDRLRRTGRKFVALPVFEGTYLAVPTERLEAILRVLRELYELDGVGSRGSLRLPSWVPEIFDDLGDAIGPMSIEAPLESVARTRAFREAGPKQPASNDPPQLKAVLRSYQREGVEFLAELGRAGRGGIVADDMGLGKTLQVIAYVCRGLAAKGPTLVVAPTSVVGNWRREIERFAPHLRAVSYHGSRRRELVRDIAVADIVITSYAVLLRDLETFRRTDFALLVLDEAQVVKNPRSRIHGAARALRAEQRIALTGTPIENNLEELWAIFEVTNPGLLCDAATFRCRYRIPIEVQRNEERLEALRRRVAPFVIRRLKSEVARELPPKTELIRSIELRGDQRDLYESIRIAAHAEVRSIVRKKGLAASTIDILSALTKLRQVCCDPRLVAVDAARDVRQSAKLTELMVMLPRLLSEGRKVLLFSQFTSMLALVSDALRLRGIRHLGLTGATRDRSQVVDAFTSGFADVFLISLKAGGTGLNLTAADTVIHYDPWWSPAAQAQATDRAYRIGQDRPVFVYNLVVAGSVEERMLSLQRRKRELADLLLSNSGESVFSADEVDELFAPLESS